MNDKYLGSCKECAKKYDYEGRRLPCVEAHKKSASQANKPVIHMLDGSAVGGNGPCPFLCAWGEVAEFALHPGKFLTNDAARNWRPELVREIEACVRGGYKVHDPQIGKAKGGEVRGKGIYEEHNGRMMSHGKHVVLKAVAKSEKWQDFSRWFLENCCADIEQLGGMVKFGWALEESRQHLLPEMGNMVAELLKNLPKTVIIMGAFAATASCPPLAPLALITGYAMDAEDIIQAGKLLQKFLAKVKGATKVGDIEEAGKLYAQFVMQLVAAGMVPKAGQQLGKSGVAKKVAGGLVEWFTKKSKNDWENAQAAKQTGAVPETGPGPRRGTRPETLWEKYRDYKQKAEDAVGRMKEAKAKGDSAAVRRHFNEYMELAFEAHLLKEFHYETMGHIQAVNRLARHFQSRHLERLQRRLQQQHAGVVIQDLQAMCQRQGIDLRPSEAGYVVVDLPHIDSKHDLRGHDATGSAHKFLAHIAEGLKRPEAPVSVEMRKIRERGEEKLKKGEIADLDEWVQGEIKSIPPERMRKMVQVDESRTEHGGDNPHHDPRTAFDFFEWASDVNTAWVQDRCYRPGNAMGSIRFDPKDGELYGVKPRHDGDRTTMDRARGWLKVMAAMLLEDGAGEYYKRPQDKVRAEPVSGW